MNIRVVTVKVINQDFTSIFFLILYVRMGYLTISGMLDWMKYSTEMVMGVTRGPWEY